MRFRAKRSRLAEVANLVGQAVVGKSTKRIFECLRLVAGEDGLELTATDLDVVIRYRVCEDIEVLEVGEAVVPAQLFVNTLREIGDETVTVVVARQKLSLDTDGGFFEIEGEDPAQFPAIPAFSAASTVQIEASDLGALVSKTVFAAGKEAARFVLNGVQMRVQKDTLRCAATDGRRLAMLTRPVTRENGMEGRESSMVVGVKGLRHFERITAGEKGPVEMLFAERFVAVRTKHAEVIARVMDGTFPDVDQILPKECTSETAVSVSGLIARLRQVRQYASTESLAVLFRFSSGELALTAAGGSGRADVRLAVEYEGDGFKVGFNPDFVLDALKVSDSETVTFGCNGSDSAAKVSDAAGFVYVIMPILVE